MAELYPAAPMGQFDWVCWIGATRLDGGGAGSCSIDGSQFSFYKPLLLFAVEASCEQPRQVGLYKDTLSLHTCASWPPPLWPAL